MREMKFSFILVLMMLLSVGTVFAADIEVYTAADLWSIGEDANLGGNHVQKADINLATTEYDANKEYTKGDVVSYNDYAYCCIVAGTHAIGETTNWTKMWEVAKGWKPIGTEVAPFHGNYDGGGHTISNLYINRGATSIGISGPTGGQNLVGLFGHVSNGSTATNASNLSDIKIKNVKLVNVDVTGQRGTGALVGKIMLPKIMLPNNNNGKLVTVENCSADTGTVKGFGATGGLVGANNSDRKQVVPIIQSSWANVEVSSTHPADNRRNWSDALSPFNIKYGGLVGCNENGITQDCYATGSVTGGDRVGGLAGCTLGGAIIRSYATGSVTQNVSDFLWNTGYGPVVGLTKGKLPPGLGGTNAPGSVEDSYYLNTDTNHIKSTVGKTTNTYGSLLPTTGSALTNYPGWSDAVWVVLDNGYPTLKASPAAPTVKDEITSTDKTDAKFSESGSWSPAIVPNLTNSKKVTISSGHTISVDSDNDTFATNINIGCTTTTESKSTLKVTATDNLIIEHKSTNTNDLTISANGNLTVDKGGQLNIGQSAKVSVKDGGELIVNGTLVQNCENDIVVSGETSNFQVNGYSSPAVKRLAIAESETPTNIKNLKVTTAELTDNTSQQFVDRSWNIKSDNSTIKEITFYWTDAEDFGYNWGTTKPVLNITDTNNEPIEGTNVVIDEAGIRSSTFSVPLGTDTTNTVFKIGSAQDSTLPVQLSTFSAVNHLNNGVMLQWVSQSESNLDGYRIYRNSVNSLEDALMLDAFFAGTNTTQTQTYTFFDQDELSNGVYYYWLQMLDYDGTHSFYGPAPVEINNEYDNSVEVPLINGFVSIYPNPFNPQATIRYSLINTNSALIELYNIKGQRVRAFDLGKQERGIHNLVWDGTDERGNRVASGLYLTKITIGKTVDMKKIMLMK